ncbi:unnamed protein product [Paramecium primaurelia]|uniref:ADP-ribosylation factor n=1 Tax=Paramecium primaurelia TaxID=5886 RepID=A0A8S1KT32_PARPR|nr:unnamed protein product [Paramecium primaurelia]
MGNPFSNLTISNKPQIIMLGFDYSGKTTILHKLKLGNIEHLVPNIGFNIEKLITKQFEIISWDVGGADKIRIIWKPYYQNGKGLIYVIDCSDRERMAEVIGELYKLMLDPILNGLPLLIYANKQDLMKLNSEELASEIMMEKISKNCYIQPCCAITGEGLKDGLKWMQQQIK